MAASLDLGSVIKPRTVPPIGSIRAPAEEEVDALGERLDTAAVLCNEQSYTEALSLASQCLQTAEVVYGSEDLRLAAPYILVGRASTGLGKLQRAEKVLSLANFIILKSGNGATAAMKSSLYRAIGRLYLARKNLEVAARVCSDDVYNSSVAYGVDDFRTAGGYCGLAAVFAAGSALEQIVAASALYSKAIIIWQTTLRKYLVPDQTEATDLSDVQKSDAQNQLLEAMQFFGTGPEPSLAKEGACATALGTLCCLRNANELAKVG